METYTTQRIEHDDSLKKETKTKTIELIIHRSTWGETEPKITSRYTKKMDQQP